MRLNAYSSALRHLHIVYGQRATSPITVLTYTSPPSYDQDVEDGGNY